MPRGGARLGAGRKPKTVVGDAGAVVAFQAIDGGRAGDVSTQPPEDLPDEQRAFWVRYAPRAIEAKTLTVQTEATFRLLCQLDARCAKLLKQIETQGETYIKAWVDSSGQEHEELKKHPLSSEFRGLAKQVEGLLARFGLAPFGKPVVSAGAAQKKAASNPWGQLMQGAK